MGKHPPGARRQRRLPEQQGHLRRRHRRHQPDRGEPRGPRTARFPTDKNVAGIRFQSTNLTVTGCYFHDNDDGILTDTGTSCSILIETMLTTTAMAMVRATTCTSIGAVGTLTCGTAVSTTPTSATGSIACRRSTTSSTTASATRAAMAADPGRAPRRTTYIIGNQLEQSRQAATDDHRLRF